MEELFAELLLVPLEFVGEFLLDLFFELAKATPSRGRLDRHSPLQLGLGRYPNDPATFRD